MNDTSRKWLFVLRLCMGWVFLYSGVTKVLNNDWSALRYIQGAKSVVFVYEWFANPFVLPVVNSLNVWGQVLLGLSLILGVGMWLSVRLGVFLMFLYYLPVLEFPMVGKTAFLVDEHVIYSLVIVLLLVSRSDEAWSLKSVLKNKKWVMKSFVSRLI